MDEIFDHNDNNYSIMGIIVCHSIYTQCINQTCSGGCGLRGMQLCIYKYVHSIHTHCLMSFAIISETFIEMAILCTQGSLINKLNLFWWMWFKRNTTMHLQICS